MKGFNPEAVLKMITALSEVVLADRLAVQSLIMVSGVDPARFEAALRANVAEVNPKHSDTFAKAIESSVHYAREAAARMAAIEAKASSGATIATE